MVGFDDWSGLGRADAVDPEVELGAELWRVGDAVLCELAGARSRRGRARWSCMSGEPSETMSSGEASWMMSCPRLNASARRIVSRSR